MCHLSLEDRDPSAPTMCPDCFAAPGAGEAHSPDCRYADAD